jgi:primosomal protein N' (replication factor Y)
VFAPVPSLGVICIDEEHDSSYKQESDPRYDARTVAAKRASLEGAVAVFGSATPRPESWASLERIELGGRIAAPMPTVKVVDLRREAGYPLSAPLLKELGGIAERGGKAILLLNRRGLAPAIHCRACGETRRCPNCDVALTLHGDASLRCHHCGQVEAMGETCPACGSAELARIGAGTQKLERALAKQIPELEVIRLDTDAVEKPEQLREALERFARAERVVLVGTQMVAKGHHFAGVELAAVIDADTGLGLPDFRAEERTFQLVTQLAGRSGREAPGRVIVQTFQPDSRAVSYAARHDVRGFLDGELERRRALGYPPFQHLVRIVVTGPELDDAMRALEELKAGLNGAELLGPAPLLRLRGRSRAQLVGKTHRPRALATRAAALLSAAAVPMRRAGLAAVVDVDPQSLYPRLSGQSSAGAACCAKIRRKALERPVLAEKVALIRAAVDLHEVARPRIHRQARLCREVAVVPLDQLVHLREAPRVHRLAPPACELVRVRHRRSKVAPRLPELLLMQLDPVLDRAQPPHPERRPAERTDRRIGVGTKVS